MHEDNIKALGTLLSPWCLCDTCCNGNGSYMCAPREEYTMVFDMISKGQPRNNSGFYFSAILLCIFEAHKQQQVFKTITTH